MGFAFKVKAEFIEFNEFDGAARRAHYLLYLALLVNQQNIVTHERKPLNSARSGESAVND